MRRWKKATSGNRGKTSRSKQTFFVKPVEDYVGRLMMHSLPLTIQENHGISELKGDVIIISYNRDLQNRIRDVLESENLKCDCRWKKCGSCVNAKKLENINW